MKPLLKVTIFFTIILSISSCQDSVIDEFGVYPGLELNDTTWSTSPITTIKTDSLFGGLALTSNVYNFDAATGADKYINDSIEVIFPANIYKNTSGTVTGNIKAEVLPLRKKGEFLRYMLSTNTSSAVQETNCCFITKLSNSSGSVDISSGNYFTFRLRDDNANPSYKMHISEFSSNNDAPYNWRIGVLGEGWTAVKPNLPLPISTAKMGYEIKCNLANRWIGNNKDFSATSFTRANVVLPVNFTNKNTVVFAVFGSYNVVLRLQPDYSSRSFYIPNMPEGADVKFVSISYIDKQYYLGSLTSTISKSIAKYSVKPDYTVLTAAQVSSFLNTL